MTLHDQQPADEDQALWQQFVQARSGDGATASIPAHTLSAYLEGRTDAAETAIVEHALANDQELLDVVTACRDIQSAIDSRQDVPASVAAAAKSVIVDQGVGARHDTTTSGVIWRWSDVWQWSAAAIILVAVGVAGYIAGQGASGYQVSTDLAVTAAGGTFGDLNEDEPAFVSLLGLTSGALQ